MSIVQISYHLKIIYSLTNEPFCVRFCGYKNHKRFNFFPAISFRNRGKHHYTTCGSLLLLRLRLVLAGLAVECHALKCCTPDRGPTLRFALLTGLGLPQHKVFPAISFRNRGKHHYTTCGSPIASLLGHNSIRSSLRFLSEIGASTIMRIIRRRGA